jgi:hypothetical protein
MIDTQERIRRLAPMRAARAKARRLAIKERAAKAAATRAANIEARRVERVEEARRAVRESDTRAAEAKTRRECRKVIDDVTRERMRRDVKPVPMGKGAVNVPTRRVIAKAAKRLGIDVAALVEIEKIAAKKRAAALLLPTEGERRKAYESARKWARKAKRTVDAGRNRA